MPRRLARGRGSRRHRGGALRARAPRGGRRQDDPRRRRLGQDRGLDRLRRRLQSLRHAPARDRDRARPQHPRGRAPVPHAAEGDDPGDRRVRLRHGEGIAALRRQRLVAPSRRVRAPSQGRAEEHELVPVPRARHRGRAAPAGRDLRERRQHLAADAALRPAARRADGAALEGGGRRLPVLPRAGPRADGADRRADRAPALGASRAARGASCALRLRVRTVAVRRRGAEPDAGDGRLLRGGRGARGRREGGRELGHGRALGLPERARSRDRGLPGAPTGAGAADRARRRRNARLGGCEAGVRRARRRRGRWGPRTDRAGAGPRADRRPERAPHRRRRGRRSAPGAGRGVPRRASRHCSDSSSDR